MAPANTATDPNTGGDATDDGSAEPTAASQQSASFEPIDVRGALYVPSRAWNTYQMWANYDRSVIERDLGYAEQLNINAVRTWLNFEYWLEAPKEYDKRIEHFLSAADERGIEVLFGLFESVGKEPNEENLTNTDPLTAVPVQSPSSAIMQNEGKWGEPREFVRWFMDGHRDDDRLLAIEVMNEPGWLPNVKHFAHGMFKTLAEERGRVPLTVGSTSLANNADYVDWGSDILQYHYNFPSNTDIYDDLLPQAKELSAQLDMPAYLTEWQRVANFGWGSTETVADQWQPQYASLAPTIHKHGVGNFFWSLMVKPAYVRYMRKRGIINGLFHEDGAVWNKRDAEAIKAMSGDDSLDIQQRRQWPEWASKVKEYAFGN